MKHTTSTIHCAIICARPALSMMLHHCIEKAGYHTAWRCPSVADALLQLHQQSTPIALVILDLQLSTANIIPDIQALLKQQSTTILICSTVNTLYHEHAFSALAHGAMHVLELDEHADSNMQHKAVRILKNSVQEIAARSSTTSRRANTTQLVVIGASTGGPSAAVELLQALPHSANIAIIFIQHLDDIFTKSMAAWMGKQLTWRVHEAKANQPLRAGEVTLAGGNCHWLLDRQHHIQQNTVDFGFFSPSIDAFLFSVVQHWPDIATAALLTGMGKDGAAGLAAFQHQGWHTFVQDEASAMIFSMPKSAIALKAANQILPPQQIGRAIGQLLQASPSSKGALT